MFPQIGNLMPCATNTFLYLHLFLAAPLLLMQPAGGRVQDFQAALKGMIHDPRINPSLVCIQKVMFIGPGSSHHVASHQGEIPHFIISNTA